MQASSSSPSVFEHFAHNPMHQPFDRPFEGFGSTVPDRADSPNRRQRISMACQYCRHRKIRCCGGAPCRNCTRSQRECEYAPVPEEVNRATREKKAIAKAAKTSHYVSPASSYTPYFTDAPVFDVPAQRPAHLGHRRSVSVPNFEPQRWAAPPAPVMHSPAMFETSQWSYPAYTAPAYPPVYPSVLEPVPYPHATPPDSRSGSTDNDVMWSTPNLHLRVPALTPHTPVSPVYYSPHPTPPLYNAYQPSTSPTLAPEMHLPQKELVGLGIHDPTYTEYRY